MDNQKNSAQGKIIISFTVILLFAVTVYSFITKLWVLTGIPVGFLFGFFLQKGDLCGSSAFSEVILSKDYRKVCMQEMNSPPNSTSDWPWEIVQ